MPLLLLNPFFPIILFLSTILLTGMTGIYILAYTYLCAFAMTSDFSVTWQFSQREQLFFSLLIKLHTYPN
jgi:hypothetical protein